MKNLGILKRKILFTIAVVIIYRLGSHIPLPTVDLAKLNDIAKIAKSGVFSMFNSFSGGAISRASIFALGIAPYITASIVMQLLVASYPSLKRIKKEGGEQGQAKISQYTKYLTIIIAFAQGYSICSGLVGMEIIPAGGSVVATKLLSAFIIVVSTMIVMWLGDQISAYGIGNGSSIIIFAGIVSEAPKDLATIFTSIKTGSLTSTDGILLFVMFAAICFIVSFAERSYRMIYVQYPRQNYNNFISHKKQEMANHQFIPLKINTSGVIPPIFASAILLLPTTIISMFAVDSQNEIIQSIAMNFNHGQPIFVIATIALIFFFSYFYNTSLFETEDLVKNLQKNGAFIPSIRPGEETSKYIKNSLKNISFIGGFYLAIICGIPESLSGKYGHSFLLGGTGLLIVFSVVNDITTQIQSHMMTAKYEKVMRKYSKK
jgi:preprotein translocase subunit SecY